VPTWIWPRRVSLRCKLSVSLLSVLLNQSWLMLALVLSSQTIARDNWMCLIFYMHFTVTTFWTILWWKYVIAYSQCIQIFLDIVISSIQCLLIIDPPYWPKICYSL
jgi:ABC-type sugar transport system permease subunit